MKKLDLGKKTSHERHVDLYSGTPIIKYLMENDNENLKICHISFREFFVCFDDCFIAVYPYAYRFIEYPNDIKITQNQQHHNDFTEGKIEYDPCLIYKKISNTQGEEDFKYDYEYGKNEFVNFYRKRLRRLKLETI